jgi:rubrerythrin
MDALLDKVCERLAVETGGVDIYHAVIGKIDDETTRIRLDHFMGEEIKHRDMLAAYLDRMGRTVHDTASAQLAEHEGQAYLKLIGEATTDAQLLTILLTVELMDETGWEMLVDLGRDLGEEEIARGFQQALKEEKEHLRGVRGMLAQTTRQTIFAAESEPESESESEADSAVAPPASASDGEIAVGKAIQ